ncbi:MAG: type IV pilus twitching motility protein PilT [Deltaproteobacteria bacterium]|nr:type IV pilus twitching motility protein PilT [Deltaproteobacteria bacterium]
MLRRMVEEGGSDLHITAGSSPQARIDGKLIPWDIPTLTPADTQNLCLSILNETQKRRFEKEKELDFSFGIEGVSRFRGNLSLQRGSVSGAFRAIPHKIRTLAELGLPAILVTLTKRPRGLVLLTGPTGSGKTTTLAAMIDQVNSERNEHIITVEDPIEYQFTHKRSLVNQREVGDDTESFYEALRHVLRQDPDVVLIGEMRDLETIQAALTISETGHLVFATLHTNSAVQTINRIIDVFPPHQQMQVRTQLSFVLEGVICQTLIPRANGKGRVVAAEVMLPNPAIRNLIREQKIHQIYSAMQAGQETHGMITFNQSLLDLYRRGEIAWEEALGHSSEPEELKQMQANRSQTKR